MHSHPCSFRLARVLDRGWGELAFEYRWHSTSGVTDADGIGCPDLAHCSLYEVTSYAGNVGAYAEGYYFPPNPPFVGWKFRDPTDGRTAPVALGCFPASQGWAWDRHKLGGSLRIPRTANEHCFEILARQEYRFQCAICGTDAVVPGSHSGPHDIVRVFAPLEATATLLTGDTTPRLHGDTRTRSLWRYTLRKHHSSAYLDIDVEGYADDSAHIGFGPPDLRG